MEEVVSGLFTNVFYIKENGGMLMNWKPFESSITLFIIIFSLSA